MSPNIESVLVGLGVGLIMLAISKLIKRIPRPAALAIAIGIGLLSFVLWPQNPLVEVPDLSNLSRDEAKLKLSSAKLSAEPQPQQDPNTLLDHVIPYSQKPLPGTKVQSGTVVSYYFSTGSPKIPPIDTLSIFSPFEGGEAVLYRGADDVFRFEVTGTVKGVDLTKSALLLWVQPVTPPSEKVGWYLQRVPNGISAVDGNTWKGLCQVGNQQWPPHNGDVINIAVSVLPNEEVARMLANQGPLTVIELPVLSSKISHLKVRIQ